MAQETGKSNPNIIHIQKRPPQGYHEAILLDAIEKSIDHLVSTWKISGPETVTVRLRMRNTLERVLCITNDDRVFHLLNDPDYKETKESLYNKFYDGRDKFIITDILEEGEDYPLKKDFVLFGYRTRILVKLEHVGVVAIHSEIDSTQPENQEIVKSKIYEFEKMVVEKIRAASEAKLVGLYQEINILTTLAQENEETAFHHVLEFVGRHHSIFRTAIFGINPANDSYTLLAGYPKGTHGKDNGFLADHPLLKSIVETKNSIHVFDLRQDTRTKWLTAPGGVVDRYGITEIAGFPISLSGEVKAVMTVDYAEKDLQFNPVIDENFFNSVCDILSNILSIVSKIKQIRIEEDIRRIVDHFLHEIRNPITASAGFARRNYNFVGEKIKQCSEIGDLCKEDFSAFLNALQRNTSVIIKESNRMEEILNEFETFIKLKRGMVEIKRESVPIVEFGKYFGDLFHGLSFSYSPELENYRLFIDRNRLHQVLLNLLINAYEHTYNMGYRAISHQPESFFREKVRFNISPREENIVFEIINGGRVPKENIDRLFEPYFTCGYHDGSGLGLAISSELVKLMNGQISFENVVEEKKDYVVFQLAIPR